MEGDGHHSASSPRKIVSVSKRKIKEPTFRDSRTTYTDGSSTSTSSESTRPGFAKEQGAKTSEVYGFVGAITTVVATVVFFAWAYLPDQWLHAVGIFYYPDRYWALAVPTYAMVTVVLVLVFYVGMNFLSTPPPTSMSNIFDDYSLEPLEPVGSVDGDGKPIEPISDVRIDRVNSFMFAERN